jgi:hypothetical protein
VYYDSGQCNSYLQYELSYKYSADDDDGNSASSQVDDGTQCSFIEGIRYGTYDTNGDIYTSMMQTSTTEGTVTSGQKQSLLGLSLLGCGLAVYSCVLHHRMTNLLLKSLSSGLVGSGKKRWARRGGKKGGGSDDYTAYSDDDESYMSGSTYGASTYA